jgi:hypothetical protein
VRARLLTLISIALIAAGIVTLNLDWAVWAKDNTDSTSKSRYSISENNDVNRDIQTQGEQTNRDQISQNNDDSKVFHGMSTPNPTTNCDPKYLCQKALDDAMAMLDNIFKSSPH